MQQITGTPLLMMETANIIPTGTCRRTGTDEMQVVLRKRMLCCLAEETYWQGNDK